MIRGKRYWKTLSFYEKLSKTFDALQTLRKEDTLTGLVMTTINELINIKPYVVCIDDAWEQWCMEDLIENLGKWLKRNKPEEQMDSPPETAKREKHWFPKGEGRASVSKPSRQGPNCMFCNRAIGEMHAQHMTCWKRERSSLSEKINVTAEAALSANQNIMQVYVALKIKPAQHSAQSSPVNRRVDNANHCPFQSAG